MNRREFILSKITYRKSTVKGRLRFLASPFLCLAYQASHNLTHCPGFVREELRRNWHSEALAWWLDIDDVENGL